jgi:RNA polymerase sigma-70 factor, ECF subfamily
MARTGRGTPLHRLLRRGLTLSLDDVIRIEGGQVLATLIRLTGDIDAAEDALQDAVVVATEAWTRDGIPEKPGAWLTTVAKNKALDRLRREARRADKEAEAVRLLTDDRAPAGDDRLRLIFTCCHPALAAESQMALALRTLCGLTTSEIARAFLIPEATAGQRISRAKAKIAHAHIPYRIPEEHELPGRLPAVMSCIYVLFTTGHDAPAGELSTRVDLCTEAVRLGRLLHELMPDEGDVVGLLALMLATDARRASRLDDDGEIVLLADQDRARWNHQAIAEAADLVESVLRRGRTGVYQVQAAIACLHGLAPTYADTDWPQIAELYAVLESLQPTPVVRLNRAVAVAHAESPAAGLALLEGLESPNLTRWHLYWSTRGELERRAGDIDAATRSLQRALVCSPNDTERRFLERSLAALT